MKPSADNPKRAAVNFADPAAERAVNGPSRPGVKFSEEQTAHRVSPGTKKILTRKPTPFSNELQQQIRDSGLAAWAAAAEKAKEETSALPPSSTPAANGADNSAAGSAAPAENVADAESAPVKTAPPANGT